MNTARANGIVVTSLMVTGSLAVIRESTAGNPPPIRLGVGLTITGIGLAAVAQLGAPDVAASLALLIAASSAVVYGGPAWERLAGATKAPAGPAPNPTTAQRPRYATA